MAPGLKNLTDAIKIRSRILLSYERAERCEDFFEAEKFMRFVIVGGGPTGVEMAGAIAEISRKSLVQNFRHIKPEQTHIYLTQVLDKQEAEKTTSLRGGFTVSRLSKTRVNIIKK